MTVILDSYNCTFHHILMTLRTLWFYNAFDYALVLNRLNFWLCAHFELAYLLIIRMLYHIIFFDYTQYIIKGFFDYTHVLNLLNFWLYAPSLLYIEPALLSAKLILLLLIQRKNHLCLTECSHLSSSSINGG